MEIRDAARRWRAAWLASWPSGDMTAVIACYAPDAVHRSTPFRPPHKGLDEIAEYFRSSVAEETVPAEVFFDEPLLAGDQAIMEWRALVVEHTGPLTIAGIAVATFTPDGLIATSRDYWHTEPGHHRVPRC